MTNEEIQEFCEVKMGNKSSIMALQRKLTRLDDLKYLRQSCPHNYVITIEEAHRFLDPAAIGATDWEDLPNATVFRALEAAKGDLGF